jgi:hypothetical protein
VLSFKASQVLKNAINDGLRPVDGGNGAAAGQAGAPVDQHPASR